MPRRPPALPLLLCAAALGGCVPEAVVGVTAGSLVFTGKTPLDHVAGLVSGQDCSAVRWERHGPWCVTPPAAPAPPPFCTRSLGSVDCWTRPPPGAPLRGVADPPR